MAATATSDVFIIGVMRFIDPETKQVREENGPQVNLSEFIRNMKFPQRLLKKPAARNSNRRVPFTKAEPIDVNIIQTQRNPNMSLTLNETTRIKTQDQNLSQSQGIPTPVNSSLQVKHPTSSISIRPATRKVSSEEEMLKLAIELSMVEHTSARTIDNLRPGDPNFNALYG